MGRNELMHPDEIARRRALIPDRFRGGPIELIDPNEPEVSMLETVKKRIAERERLATEAAEVMSKPFDAGKTVSVT